MSIVEQGLIPVNPKESSWGQGPIKLIGVGTAGASIVSDIFVHLPELIMPIICDSDADVLHHSAVPHKFLLEAEEHVHSRSREERIRQGLQKVLPQINELIDPDTRLVIFVGGLGRTTTPIALKAITEQVRQAHPHIPLLSLLVMPLPLEGKRRLREAQEQFDELKPLFHIATRISNDRLFKQNPNLRVEEAFHQRNEFIRRVITSLVFFDKDTLQLNLPLEKLADIFHDADEARVGFSVRKGLIADVVEMLEQAQSHPFMEESLQIRRAQRLVISLIWHPNVQVTAEQMDHFQQRLNQEAPDADRYLVLGPVPTLPEEEVMLLLIATYAAEQETISYVEPGRLHPTEQDNRPLRHPKPAPAPNPSSIPTETTISENPTPAPAQEVDIHTLKNTPAYLRKQKKALSSDSPSLFQRREDLQEAPPKNQIPFHRDRAD